MTDFLQGLLGALLTRSAGWLGHGGLEVVAQDDTALTVRGGGRDVVFNKRHGTVKSGASVLARFGDIESVDIRRHADDEGPDRWSVSLKLRGWFARVRIGWTGDAVEASIVAARICTCTGKPVRSL